MAEKFEYLWESWLDKFGWVMVLVCLAATGVVMYTHHQEVSASGVVAKPLKLRPVAKKHSRTRAPEVEAALKDTLAFLESKKYSEAIELAQRVIQTDPAEPFAYVYLARASKGANELHAAINNYAKAVELYPEFVDKNSPDKIGPELKPFVKEALRISNTPEFKADKRYKKTIKKLYYLQRRLAGGCE